MMSLTAIRCPIPITLLLRRQSQRAREIGRVPSRRPAVYFIRFAELRDIELA
jgi:hypothetical protein